MKFMNKVGKNTQKRSLGTRKIIRVKNQKRVPRLLMYYLCIFIFLYILI